mmetsp:Transcript_52308/g.131376  ORF Transcript_52308/g.131376 Transcript_52308/m.131376 type:complete len:90 (-) Transcript_52308:256-525(-)
MAAPFGLDEENANEPVDEAGPVKEVAPKEESNDGAEAVEVAGVAEVELDGANEKDDAEETKGKWWLLLDMPTALLPKEVGDEKQPETEE